MPGGLCGHDGRSTIDSVEFEPESPTGPFRQYIGLLWELEALFGRKVDLVELQAMRNPYLIKVVNATRVLVYAA